MTAPSPGGTVPTAPPVCPRHPDRVSYVRCQRCERPVCPECQRTAAVGVHCIDCVREGQRTAPVARTAFGAPVRGGRPVVTLTLIALCVVSFVIQLATQGLPGGGWTGALYFSPATGEIEPWRFLSAAFLHLPSSVIHIGFNMYALWIFGQNLENILGRTRFLTLYLVSALGGSVMVLLLADPTGDSWFRPVVGASGAIFGLFGGTFVLLRRLGRSAQPMIVLIVINGVLGFVIPRVSWQGHLGGLLAGAVLGLAFAYAPKARRREVAIVATVVLTVALVALAVLRYSGT
jgi:membrane associated rhomboid family serine protease